MALTYEKVREFVRKHGKTVALVPSKEARILPNGEVDSIHLVENAARFLFEGKSYSKAEFEKFVDLSN